MFITSFFHFESSHKFNLWTGLARLFVMFDCETPKIVLNLKIYLIFFILLILSKGEKTIAVESKILNN